MVKHTRLVILQEDIEEGTFNIFGIPQLQRDLISCLFLLPSIFIVSFIFIHSDSKKMELQAIFQGLVIL